MRRDYETALEHYQEALDIAEKKLVNRPDEFAVFWKNVERAKDRMKK